MADSLLVELLTEELPPKALSALGGACANGIRDELVALGLAPKGGAYAQGLATPRRLAVRQRSPKKFPARSTRPRGRRAARVRG
jgi:glycyl-tRNA synthetase beta chain